VDRFQPFGTHSDKKRESGVSGEPFVTQTL
jgi:hypothetical protein